MLLIENGCLPNHIKMRMPFKTLNPKPREDQSKNHYTEGKLTPEEEDDEHPHSKLLKKFWGYIKSVKKDTSGVFPIKKDGVLVSGSNGKADILNQQYTSVFTREDINSTPDLGISPYHTLPALVIQQAVLVKLLRNPQPIKQPAQTDFPTWQMVDAGYYRV